MTNTWVRGRGIGGLLIALVVLIGVVVSGSGGASGTVAADSGPVFDRVTLSAATVARGDTVTIIAHIADATADVLDTPVIFFALPDDFAGPGIPFTRVSGDARDGQYHADFAVSPLLPVGKYPVREVRAYDGDGNATFVSPPDPRVASVVLTVTDGPMASATVSATTAAPPPAATTTATAPRAANTPAPATATASRPTPTPMFTPVALTGPGPDATNTPASRPAIATATAVGARVTVLPAATARATTPPTATSAASAPTATRAGATPAATAAFVPRSPTTPAPRTTGKAPSLAWIAITPDTVYPGDALTVTARITAGSADVEDLATLRYRLPDGTDGPFAYLRRIVGTGRDGTYVATVGLSPFFPPGTYTLSALTLSDADGNTTVYTASMRPDASFSVAPFVPPTDSAG